jgi:arylsulfatase A
MKFICCFVFALWFPVTQSGAQPKNAPNIVLFYADDLGYGDLGCYGNPDIKTPFLDQLAKEGMRFTDFYSPAPICSPSRAGLLTGKYPIQLGIQNVFFPESWNGLSPSETLIPEALRPSGYQSGLVGKWHLGHHKDYLPVSQGFDYYFGVPYSNDMAGLVYIRNSEILEEKVNQDITTQRFTKEAGSFIRENSKQPFFLMVAYTMPHVPLHASEAFKGKSIGGLYGDCVEEMDASIGTLVRLIDSLGLGNNTLILFTSDNGPWLSFGKDGGSAKPLRGGKQVTFEGGMRVPLVARWKTKIAPGFVNNSVSSQLDFLPTFLDLAGSKSPLPAKIRGTSMRAQLLNQAQETEREMAFFSQGKLEAYRVGDWKLKLPQPAFEGNWYRMASQAHDTLLFNLKTDPGETKDAFATNHTKAREILKKMNAFHKEIQPLPPLLETKREADNAHKARQRTKSKEE